MNYILESFDKEIYERDLRENIRNEVIAEVREELQDAIRDEVREELQDAIRDEAKRELIKKMLERGVPIDEISNYIGESTEKIQILLKE